MLDHCTTGASGKVVFTDIAAASYIFRVVAKRPGARIVQRRVLHILGELNSLCAVLLILIIAKLC